MANLNKIGIYIIKNKINGKCYVGSTVRSFNQRKNEHFKNLKSNKHNNRYLQNAWNKYGEENFEFKVLKIIDEKDKDKILEVETYFIKKYMNDNKSYNLTKCAGSILGYKFTEEQRRKMKEINSANKHPGAILDLNDCFEIKKMLIKKIKVKNISKTFNVNEEVIYRIKRGKHWSSKALGGSYGEWIYRSKIEELNKIKDELIKNTNEKAGDKIKRIANNFKVSISEVEKIKKGKHNLSNKIGGGYKDWLKENKDIRKNSRKLTINNLYEIKDLIIKLKPNNTWDKVYSEISEKFNISKRMVRKIKDGDSEWIYNEIGSYKEWIEELNANEK